mmetsp:Transcript_44721/g.104459  ORF Transcript_44721/g.104459 Transcript_44721/m.104459 type:complete len:275 (-) Transcript_44721:231-1055(-)
MVFGSSADLSSARTSSRESVCCLWKPKTFQSKHKCSSKTYKSPNCTLASLRALASLRIEHVVRSSSPSSLFRPKSARYLATLSAVCWEPVFFWSDFLVFLATTSERILAEASAMRSERVVASILKRRPESAGSWRSMLMSAECSSTLASTTPSANTETPGVSPRRKDISPITSPLPRFATSLEDPVFFSETEPFLMKKADSEALPSSMSSSPVLKVVEAPTELKSCSRNSLWSPVEARKEMRCSSAAGLLGGCCGGAEPLALFGAPLRYCASWC